MNREEILNKSRSENQNGDERERQIHVKAGDVAFRAGAAVCILMVFVDEFIHTSVHMSLPAMALYFCMGAASKLYTGITLRKSYDIFFGVSLVIAAAVVFCIYAGVWSV